MRPIEVTDDRIEFENNGIVFVFAPPKKQGKAAIRTSWYRRNGVHTITLREAKRIFGEPYAPIIRQATAIFRDRAVQRHQLSLFDK